MKVTKETQETIKLTRDEVFTAILEYLHQRYTGKYFTLERLDDEGATVYTETKKESK